MRNNHDEACAGAVLAAWDAFVAGFVGAVRGMSGCFCCGFCCLESCLRWLLGLGDCRLRCAAAREMNRSGKSIDFSANARIILRRYIPINS